MTDSPAPAPPLLRIVRGDPTPEELAALVAVVAATAGGGAGPAPAAPRSEWAAPYRRLRGAGGPRRHGAGAWRASAH